MNGSTAGAEAASSAAGLTLAQKMMMQHEQNEKQKPKHSYKPSVEAIEDEEDILHPATHETTPGAVLEEVDAPSTTPSWVQPKSEKAAGKEKDTGNASRKAQPLDLKSDDAFPSLGGPKPSATSAAPSWGARNAARPAGTNGASSNGYSSNASSRASTPASGNRTPASVQIPGRLRGPGGQLQLPGRNNQLATETLTMMPEQMTPRSQLKRPVAEILREITSKTKATVDTSTSSSGIATFIVKGTPDAVRRAKREIGRDFGLKKSIAVPIPIWARPHIIGRGGTTIQKISEKTGAKVQVPKPGENEEDDEALIDVSIEGDAFGVDQAKAEVERIVKDRQNLPRQKLEPGQKAESKPRGPVEDEVTLNLKIKPQYHRELIGARGSQVNRLQERYDVRVNFPRSAPSAAASDAGSEYGGLRSPRPPQASDEVIIRGPRKGAEEAREELLNLLQYIAENSHTDTVTVQAAQISSLIGQGGREISNLRLETGAQIDVPQVDKEANPSERVSIKLKGTKKQVEDAKKVIQERAKVFDKTVVRTIDVDKKHHKALIGGQGSKIRDIVVAAGGSDDRRELARTVRFPKQGSEGNEIRVEGDKEVVAKIVAAIQKLVNERESSVTELVDVAPESHRILIGRGGETRQGLEKEFNVSIDIPRQQAAGKTSSGVKVVGQPEDVANARERIEQMIKEYEGQTFQIPRHLHHNIADGGQFFRRLKNDHQVTVDHSGQQPPARPDPAARRQLASSDEPLPLITDAVVTETISWEIYDMSEDTSLEQGEIPWILRGPPPNVVRAATILRAALEQAQRETITGYLVLPDPTKHRHVIGHGGSQVNSIRKKTGCRIVVPRDQSPGEAIEIFGNRDNVEQARAIILEVIASAGDGDGSVNGGEGGGRGGRRRRG